MKKFEWPVVLLTEMSMNESIASICCYSETSTSTLNKEIIVRTILNGGRIGSIADKFNLIDGVSRAFGGVLPPASQHEKITFTTQSDDDWLARNNSTSFASYTVVTAVRANYDWVASAQVLSEGAVVDATRLVFPNGSPFTRGGLLGTYVRIPGQAFSPATIAAEGAVCSHNSFDCPWVAVKASETVKTDHIGSVLPHVMGGPEWYNPHLAQKYSS
ncbi:hypothetical protein AGMMS49992_02390 [Clostridia bacterium]|nr:hypothetical protein AGMMS49992_02390 [Clostridia bacterium]